MASFIDQRFTIYTDLEIGTIRPELHGHFAEHLGSCVYGGLWVGRDSWIPNINGHRTLAVEYLSALGIPVLRWPGGAFADGYHWRDGIGPAARRPRRVNICWGYGVEDNSFGTHEFVELCRLIGAQPYICANLGSGTPQEMRDWMEYCNYDGDSALAREREANGSREPFQVRYWGIGNEVYAAMCGWMKPEEYAAAFGRFATYAYRGFMNRSKPAYLIACGNDLNWNRRFLEALRPSPQARNWRVPIGLSMHDYSTGKNLATKFTAEAMREQLAHFADIEKAVIRHRAMLDTFDPDRKIGFLIDEWGVWDRIDPAEAKRFGMLYQQNTMRSALAAGLGLNLFHRQADKLVMANLAQTVNVLHSLLLADGDRCVRTPTYYAYELMKPHRSNTALQIETKDKSPLGMSVSASRREKEVVISCVNPQHEQGVRAEFTLVGAAVGGGQARMLQNDDFNACNTFDAPDRIVPTQHAINVDRTRLTIEAPPLSITTAVVRLA